MIVGCLLANMQEILPGTRKSLEMAGRTGYLALTGEVAEWSKALPC